MVPSAYNFIVVNLKGGSHAETVEAGCVKSSGCDERVKGGKREMVPFANSKQHKMIIRTIKFWATEDQE
jgi:hypothetical protein